MRRRRTLGASVLVVAFGLVGLTLVGPTTPSDAATNDADQVLLVEPNGRWHVRFPGASDYTFWYGVAGDVPLLGDWDGDGYDTPGMYRASNGFAYLTNDLPPNGGVGFGDPALTFFFGIPGDRVFVGDWNGDGIDTLRLHIKESLSEVGGTLHLGPPKSNKPRWVSIPAFLTELIAKHLYRQPDGTVEALAFTSTTGQPLRHSNFYSRIWRPAIRDAGLPPGLRIHDLRHTAAAFMIDEGAHLELVRQQLGHSSITVTQKYAHLYPSATEDLAARLDDRYRQVQQQPVGLVWG